MVTGISKTQIDRLGDRLRKGNIADSDLRLLDEYRRSFNAAYGVVAGGIRRQLDLEPTGRPAKSTTSIAEKLRRESIRLSQIQDIAGCRLIVSDTAEQDRVVASLVELFPDNSVADRRRTPSHGYRAVHVIAKVEQKGVEIQIRTTLQQLWAELSEKLSDLIEPAIKYGGGDESIKRLLTSASKVVARHEATEVILLKVQNAASGLSSDSALTQQTTEAIISRERKVVSTREETVEMLHILIEDAGRLKQKEYNAVLN